MYTCAADLSLWWDEGDDVTVDSQVLFTDDERGGENTHTRQVNGQGGS